MTEKNKKEKEKKTKTDIEQGAASFRWEKNKTFKIFKT